MNIKEKLLLIQQMTGLTQTKLADELGVSFVTLNSWINQKSYPRKPASERIDQLLQKYTGQKKISSTALITKKNILSAEIKKHSNIIREIINNPDIRDQLLLALTYHSNSIEGSSLSQNDTAAILFDNVSLPNKSLVEQLEAKNHQTALEYLWQYLADKKPLNEKLILKLHSILLNGIHAEAGRYRDHPVRIVGSYVPTANHLKVSALMKQLVKTINNPTKNWIAKVTNIHSKFEQIHPFADGNGRTGRLLMQAMLLQRNIAPAIIKQGKKQLYYAYLQKAQLEHNSISLQDFICDAILDGFAIINRK